MSQPAVHCLCPACHHHTKHAVLAVPPASGPLSGNDLKIRRACGFRQQLICLECKASWDTVGFPTDQVQQLLAACDALEEARHKITMLRLLLAQQRKQQVAGESQSEATPDDADSHLKIRRAA